MTKLLALAAALALAFSTSISAAQAGGNGVRLGIGIGVGALAIGAIANGAQRSEAREYQGRKKTRAARREREEQAPTRSTKKPKAEKTEVAEEETAVPVDSAKIDSETSSIASSGEDAAPAVITGSAEPATLPENSSVALTSAEEPAPPKTAAATTTASQGTKALDCKKFFPSVGMTLSVPCE
ncbi:MAG: hypothetical protein WDN31_16545 [Hyphomicrobium sp.]